MNSAFGAGAQLIVNWAAFSSRSLNLSELIVLYVARFRYFLQVHVVDVRLTVHEEVLVLAFDLHSFVYFSLDLDDFVLTLTEHAALVGVYAGRVRTVVLATHELLDY